MNDFTKNITQALFNQDKINDLLRHSCVILLPTHWRYKKE
ncbi:MAG: Hypothetical protein LKU_02319 [Lactobacillus kefiranofaciens]|nr:Hypothetical protein WANG_1558 [Lactobacillus kefiranofaciens subsp. kefiranofaciens]